MDACYYKKIVILNIQKKLKEAKLKAKWQNICTIFLSILMCIFIYNTLNYHSRHPIHNKVINHSLSYMSMSPVYCVFCLERQSKSWINSVKNLQCVPETCDQEESLSLTSSSNILEKTFAFMREFQGKWKYHRINSGGRVIRNLITAKETLKLNNWSVCEP